MHVSSRLALMCYVSCACSIPQVILSGIFSPPSDELGMQVGVGLDSGPRVWIEFGARARSRLGTGLGVPDPLAAHASCGPAGIHRYVQHDLPFCRCLGGVRHGICSGGTDCPPPARGRGS